MEMATLETKLNKLSEQYNGIDKKIDVLINSVEHENKSSLEFRIKASSDIEKLRDRMELVEKKQAVSGVALNDFNLVKNTIIKWIVGMFLGFAGIAGAIVTYLPK